MARDSYRADGVWPKPQRESHNDPVGVVIADDFDASFNALTGYRRFRWQRRLYEEHFRNGNLPSGIDIPTGLGKTSMMAI